MPSQNTQPTLDITVRVGSSLVYEVTGTASLVDGGASITRT